METRFGTVPEFEEREAARYCALSWTDWTNKADWYDRAGAVAHYRTHLSVEAHLHDAAEFAANKQRANARARRS